MLSKKEIERILDTGTAGEIAAEANKIDNLDLDLPVVSIYIVRNYTIEPLLPFIKLHFFNKGLKTDINIGDYDVLEQSFMSPLMSEHIQAADIVNLSLYMDTLDINCNNIFWSSNEVSERLNTLFDLARSNCRGLIVLNKFLLPLYSDVGVSSSGSKNNRYHSIAKLNESIDEYAAWHSDHCTVIDWNMLLAQIGAKESLDSRFWYTSKSPFKKGFLALYAGEITKIAAALKGRQQKVLVLDCDNTLWGGVIGEDGIDGIELDPHDYPGNVFYAFQQKVLNLYERGVMIVLNSKNNESDVFDVLEKHPHCLLGKEHLVGWRINWLDKIVNLKELAGELNVSTDSFVFIDDSHMECELVDKYMPEIKVIQVPKKLYELPDILLKGGYFDTLQFSNEDRQRTKMYRQSAARRKEEKRFENIEEYLASLEMISSIHEIRADEVLRVAQLTQKTNQFNMTTLRLSEEDVAMRVNNDSYTIYSMKVEDRFGGSGLTAVIFLLKEDVSIEIENFLMSCRVLGRNLEYNFISHCLRKIVESTGVTRIRAKYIATSKNSQVANFWGGIGMQNEDDGAYAANYESLHIPSTGYINVVED